MMQPTPPKLPTLASEIDVYLEGKGITGARMEEFKSEGFPAKMVAAFLVSAEETQTIVSSRLPGGVGTDLIDAGYDLKGFQIKAKSCDWGPMAGFICQLPFLNKKGYDNIAYNTIYISEYLDALKRFSGCKEEIEAKRDVRKKILSILNALPSDSIKPIGGFKKEMDKVSIKLGEGLSFAKFRLTDNYKEVLAVLKDVTYYDDKKDPLENLTIIKRRVTSILDNYISKTVVEYRAAEQKTAKWSGENEIPGSFKNIPFIPLKRAYTETSNELVAKLNGKLGIKDAKLNKSYITGTAYNSVNEDGTVDIVNSTIKLDFALVPDDTSKPTIWSIYYKTVSFRPPNKIVKTHFSDYSFDKRVLGDELLQKLGIKPKVETDTNFIEYVNQILSRNESIDPIQFKSVVIDGSTYSPVCGIMNPHPPYPQMDPDSYKNAVSGDFDLFAFWPRIDRGYNELIRLSETNLTQDLKYSRHSNGLFWLDFIPGFKELTSALAPEDKNRLKENAEIGNINGLGSLVAGVLNSAAHAIYAMRIAVNKAFHSDEGGRPGVMEIEFPIAIFFPTKIKTKALNNTGAKPTPQSGRTELETCGGLIKNIEDLMQLIIDLNYSNTPGPNKYKVVLHSEWMMHLFYMALPVDQLATFTSKEWFQEVYGHSADGSPISNSEDKETRKTAINKRMGEFAKIKANHNAFYGTTSSVFDQENFTKSFIQVLQNGTGPAVSVGDPFSAYAPLQQAFLKMAFQSDMEAMSRKKIIATIYSKLC